jgi:hypothetical protein
MLNRLTFMLSPLLASCAKAVPQDPTGPTCPNCGARNDEIMALNDADELVVYLCKRNHVFGQWPGDKP